MLITGAGINQAPWSRKDMLRSVEFLALEVEHMNIPRGGPERRALGIKGSRRVSVEATEDNGGKSRYRTEGPQDPCRALWTSQELGLYSKSRQKGLEDFK